MSHKIALANNIWLENLYESFGQFFLIDKIIYQEKTAHQEIIIFENKEMGRVMALDGVIQTTERDEFFYHEMLAHVPLFSHGYAKNVLIIGGGDGGLLREVCRHSNIEKIFMVEIDANVIEFCRQYFPNHNAGSYNDPRFNLIIDDGVNFVNQTNLQFDIIISDCTDPIGPGENLFTSDFYHGCKRCLSPKGIFVAQNGVSFLQPDEVVTSYKRLSHYFADVSFYQAGIPTYYGGEMSFAWATNDKTYRQHSTQTIANRINQSAIHCRYYNAAIHTGSFALPQYLIDAFRQ